jgi:sugar phosphate permease
MPRLRWLMIVLCYAATTINYVDRAVIAVAAPFMQRELHLDPAVMGLVLGAFFWTYALMQVPAGWIVDRIGARITYAAAVAWWSLFTGLTAFMGSAAAIFGCRLMLGVGEAGAYPSNVKVAASWFPTRERGLASGIFDSGSRTGSALSLPIVSALVFAFGWRAAFVLTGAVGLAWVAVWLCVYRDPQRHPGVSAEQLAALRREQPTPAAPENAVSLASLFTHRTVWAMMGGFFCLNFVFYFYTTWFPTYLVQSRGFSLRQLGLLGMLPGLAAIPSSWLGGFISDRLYRHGWSLTAARKTCLVGGMLLSSVIALSAFVASDAAALTAFTVAYMGIAIAGANIWSLPGDVAPTPAHVASLSGIQNCAANLSGIVIATFTGLMLSITRGSFVLPLCVCGGFCVLGASIYLFGLGRIEPLQLRGRRPAVASPATSAPG